MLAFGKSQQALAGGSFFLIFGDLSVTSNSILIASKCHIVMIFCSGRRLKVIFSLYITFRIGAHHARAHLNHHFCKKLLSNPKGFIADSE